MSAILWYITVLVWATTSLTVPHGRGDDAACKCLETTAKEAGSGGSGKEFTTCATLLLLSYRYSPSLAQLVLAGGGQARSTTCTMKA